MEWAYIPDSKSGAGIACGFNPRRADSKKRGDNMNKEKLIAKKNEIYNKFIAYDFRDKSQSFFHYCTQYLNRTQRMFEYSGLPETIPAEYLERFLQVCGFAVIAKVNGNLYAFVGGLGGNDESPYNEPTFSVIANPALRFNKTLYIDRDCVLIRNDVALEGIAPIIARYASALLENDISLDMMSKNMRSNILLNAPTNDLKKAAEKALSDIDNGARGIIGGFNYLKGIEIFPTGATSATRITDLIEYHQYLRSGLYNELGLQSNFNMKRESLNTAETGMNDDVLIPLIDEMLKQREQGVERVNQMFGTNILVKLSSIWETVHDEITNPEPEQETQPEPETDTGGGWNG